jgi:hypothetical protein
MLRIRCRVLQCPVLNSWSILLEILNKTIADGLGNLRKLAAPQCVAGLGVRLDFHRIFSFPGIFLYWVTSKPGSRCFAYAVKLAAPQCAVASLGVRLDFHRISPFFRLKIALLHLSNASEVPKVTKPVRQQRLALCVLKIKEIVKI